MTRSYVYAALDREREKQIKKFGELDSVNQPADFICYIHHYLGSAIEENNPLSYLKTMTAIRKLAALGIACMEKFGAGLPVVIEGESGEILNCDCYGGCWADHSENWTRVYHLTPAQLVIMRRFADQKFSHGMTVWFDDHLRVNSVPAAMALVEACL